MRRRACSLVIALLMAVEPGGAVAFQTSRPDVELETGIRQVREGEFDAALITLDAVVRRLATEPARTKELARAYVYLAIAYFSLEQTESAKARFIEALKLDKELEISTKEFPPKVVEFFKDVQSKYGARRHESAAGTAARSTESTEPGVAARDPEPPEKNDSAGVPRKGGGGKGLWILAGAAAVGAGVTLAAKSEGTTATNEAASDFLGSWRGPIPGSISRLVITRQATTLIVHYYGQCSPECDNGEATTPSSDADDHSLTVVWLLFGTPSVEMRLTLVSSVVLQAAVVYTYTDGRATQRYTENLGRQ